MQHGKANQSANELLKTPKGGMGHVAGWRTGDSLEPWPIRTLDTYASHLAF